MTNLICPSCLIPTNDNGFCQKCEKTWRWDIIAEFSEEWEGKEQQELFDD